MPNKLQFRLLSNSGELLNVVTCHAGRVSVLRAATPSDLRPYQRALAGSSGKENIQVLCDGVQFRSIEHTLIGFGELSPTSGLTVREFLDQFHIPEDACTALLRSVGLESIKNNRCAELSTEQEARLRLVAATSDTSKALILNDPFEHISGQWRERIAALLASVAETQNALIVIPALSYRPEGWINNRVIERIEVGQTSQGTIGFGSAGSASNAAMADLINKVRQDPRFAAQTVETRHNAGDISSGLAGSALTITPSFSPSEPAESSTPSTRGSIFKASSIVLGAGLTACIGLMMVGVGSKTGQRGIDASLKLEANEPKRAPSTAVESAQPPNQSDAQHNATNQTQQQSEIPTTTASLSKASNPPPELFALDLYPQIIKTSLLDTVKGVTNFVPSHATEAGKVTSKPNQESSGNLFSLLEKASNDTSPASNYIEQHQAREYVSDNVSEEIPSYSEPTEEEIRREEIRNRFLAAIQAAAERRQPSMAEEE